ncbi:MAG: hypothetical protein GXO40_00055 [Epsilonproteobacteria bacterium]|nr:hypothetical protein [Campylobacterota bacterium]
MKKSFTLIEAVITITVTGLLSLVFFGTLERVYEGYLYSVKMNSLNTRLDSAMNIIASRLQDRIKNTVIASDGNHFEPISRKTKGDNYHNLEWLGIDYEAKHGQWDVNHLRIQPGWSGFCDVAQSYYHTTTNQGSIVSQNSNFDMVEDIDYDILNSYGEHLSSKADVFGRKYVVLIFSGNDLGGEITNTIEDSYGWYHNYSKSIYSLQEGNDETTLHIAQITPRDNDTPSYIFERYYLVRSANGIVPEQNAQGDYNLTFVYNYRPWLAEKLSDGNRTLIATNVKQFQFWKDTNSDAIWIRLCIHDTANTEDINLCKTKEIY